MTEPTWRRIAASYAMAAATVLLLWVVSRPVVGGLAVASVAGAAVAGRRAYGFARCLRDCRHITVRLGSRTRITVARGPTDEAC